MRGRENFWKWVEKQSNGCWLWVGNTHVQGYGRVHLGHRQYKKAHRFSWELHNGPIPEGLRVCHKCDVRACVNPAHLFIGTDADNMRDRDAKHRLMHGERTNTAKLTFLDVKEIRRIYDSGECRNKSDLSRRFGVSDQMIGRIVRRLNWMHFELADETIKDLAH